MGSPPHSRLGVMRVARQASDAKRVDGLSSPKFGTALGGTGALQGRTAPEAAAAAPGQRASGWFGGAARQADAQQAGARHDDADAPALGHARDGREGGSGWLGGPWTLVPSLPVPRFISGAARPRLCSPPRVMGQGAPADRPGGGSSCFSL
jgi:hypothetical protein